MLAISAQLSQNISCQGLELQRLHSGRLQSDLADKGHCCNRRPPQHWKAVASHVAEFQHNSEGCRFASCTSHGIYIALVQAIQKAHFPFEMSVATIFVRDLLFIL